MGKEKTKASKMEGEVSSTAPGPLCQLSAWQSQRHGPNLLPILQRKAKRQSHALRRQWVLQMAKLLLAV